MKDFLHKDLPSLLLRVGFSALLMTHGFGKLMRFQELASQFPDPFGLGSRTSIGLVVFAEFLCSASVLVGFLTRLATLPIIFTMGVALATIHLHHSIDKQELPLMYAIAFVSILFLGPGRASLDFWLRKKQ